MIRAFLEEHGSGFWLHGLGAIAIVLLFWYFLDAAWLGFVVSTLTWFFREVLQHSIRTVWTFHRILEWGTPLITGLVVWGLLTLF